jgi:hypothetical protein
VNAKEFSEQITLATWRYYEKITPSELIDLYRTKEREQYSPNGRWRSKRLVGRAVVGRKCRKTEGVRRREARELESRTREEMREEKMMRGDWRGGEASREEGKEEKGARGVEG